MYYFDRCSSELAKLVLLHHSCGRSTRYSNRLHGFSVTMSRYYKDVYVHSLFSRAAGLWNSLPTKWFPLTYDLNGFMSRVNRHLFSLGSFYLAFLYPFQFFPLLFLVTPCLVVAVQPLRE